MACCGATPYGDFMAAKRCELGGRLRRCSRPPCDTCQYCTRPFCREHAYVLEGYDAVCARPSCSAKHDDLPSHYAYVRGIRLRNHEGFCGIVGCEIARGFDCSKCGGRFCLGHLSDQMYPSAGLNQPSEMAIVCAHCWERRTIWSNP